MKHVREDIETTKYKEAKNAQKNDDKEYQHADTNSNKKNTFIWNHIQSKEHLNSMLKTSIYSRIK